MCGVYRKEKKAIILLQSLVWAGQSDLGWFTGFGCPFLLMRA